jgi:hypothetical protein
MFHSYHTIIPHLSLVLKRPRNLLRAESRLATIPIIIEDDVRER